MKNFLSFLIVTTVFCWSVVAQDIGSIQKRSDFSVPEKIQGPLGDPLPAGTYSIGSGGDFPKIDSAFNKLSIEEMTGGNFTITNGGIFGSMLSTPIINAPQSAILGMHNIVERPVAINGEVVIRPMMYVALSYDHRIVDGRESVSFLVRVKELLEDPTRLLLEI